jgi:hypothetical protein
VNSSVFIYLGFHLLQTYYFRVVLKPKMVSGSVNVLGYVLHHFRQILFLLVLTPRFISAVFPQPLHTPYPAASSSPHLCTFFLTYLPSFYLRCMRAATLHTFCPQHLLSPPLPPVCPRTCRLLPPALPCLCCLRSLSSPSINVRPPCLPFTNPMLMKVCAAEN